jgi:glycosyltransferase involved in cell wall biosynthesis
VKKIILFVHQSADLYGSDRVLLTLVTRLDRENFMPVVLLPVNGPLVAELAAASVECHVLPITGLSRATLSLRGILGMPANLLRSLHAINHALNGRHVDVVHSNTLAVLSGAIWARWYRVPHVWHVHEIIQNPTMVRKVYAQLLRWLADCIICVSYAAKDNLLQDKPSLTSRIQVVWNGLSRNASVEAGALRAYRHQLGMNEGEILVALVGRINRWKGQNLLVEAANLLSQQGIRNIRYLVVGSAPEGQAHFLDELQTAISQSPAKPFFMLQSFTPDIWTVWDACDIAVIPSIEPEPFGMVALEAMSSAKPVVAANHGGLAEIVVHGETGLLVQPSNALALANAIGLLASDAKLRKRMGTAGELRYRDLFTLDRHVSNMARIYQEMP